MARIDDKHEHVSAAEKRKQSRDHVFRLSKLASIFVLWNHYRLIHLPEINLRDI